LKFPKVIHVKWDGDGPRIIWMQPMTPVVADEPDLVGTYQLMNEFKYSKEEPASKPPARKKRK
jgi:hypothetical protein